MAVFKYPVPAVELRAAVLQALEKCEARADEAPMQLNSTSILGPGQLPVRSQPRKPQPICAGVRGATRQTGPRRGADPGVSLGSGPYTGTLPLS